MHLRMQNNSRKRSDVSICDSSCSLFSHPNEPRLELPWIWSSWAQVSRHGVRLRNPAWRRNWTCDQVYLVTPQVGLLTSSSYCCSFFVFSVFLLFVAFRWLRESPPTALGFGHFSIANCQFPMHSHRISLQLKLCTFNRGTRPLLCFLSPLPL